MSIVERVADRYKEALTEMGDKEFEFSVRAALGVHDRLQQWLRIFSRGLRKAVEMSAQLPEGRVWAKPVSDLWSSEGGPKEALGTFRNLYDVFDDIGMDVDYLSDVANMCRNALLVPKSARIEAVMKTVKHHSEAPPGMGATWAISYDVSAAEQWVKVLKSWSEKSEALLKKALKRGQQEIQRQAR